MKVELSKLRKSGGGLDVVNGIWEVQNKWRAVYICHYNNADDSNRRNTIFRLCSQRATTSTTTTTHVSSLLFSSLSLFLIRLWKNLCGSTLAHGLDNLFVLNVVLLVGLELDSDTAERALEGLLRGGVDHLGLFYFEGSQLVSVARFGKYIFYRKGRKKTNRRTHLDASIIGGPGDKGHLVAGTLARSKLVLEIVDGISGTLADGAL